MKERPILFSGPMVRAILEGRKTMTRRVVKLRYGADVVVTNGQVWKPARVDYAGYVDCPYGQVGDRLWVRENFCPIYPQDPHYNGGRPIEYDYQATYQHGYRLGDLIGEKKKWKPSIHMPRIASRILPAPAWRRCAVRAVPYRAEIPEGTARTWPMDANHCPDGWQQPGNHAAPCLPR